MTEEKTRDNEQTAPEETGQFGGGADEIENDRGHSASQDTHQQARWLQATSSYFPKLRRCFRRHCLTIVLILIYVTQTWYMRQTLIASERAWVLLDSVDLNRTVALPGGQFSRYQVIFRNFGKGPATDVSICAEATAERKPSPTSYTCEIHTEIVAAPGGLVWITVGGPTFPETVKQLYIRGTVKYLDQFGIARNTEYCTSPLVRPDNTVTIGGCERNRAE